MWKALLCGLVVVLLVCPTVMASGHDPASIVRWESDWPTFFDPAVGTDYSDLMTMVSVHDSLVFPNDDGTIRPHLATEWTVSDDGLVYTFKLRDDVKFHNGDLLKASDVVFSFNRLQTIGEGIAYLFRTKDESGNIIAGVETVDAIDDHTVQFKLVRPYGPFLSALVRLYIVNERQVMENIDKSSRLYGEYGDYAKGWYLTHDAGCGPYTVTDVRMEEYVMGEKFDDYWGGWEDDAPDFFKIFASPGEIGILTLMKNKEMEFTDEWQSQEAYARLRDLDNVDVVEFFVGQNLNLLLNTKKPPTDDVHFRKALSYIFDYDTVNDVIWPANRQSVGPVPFDVPGHADVYQYKRDPEKAKAELALSKYADNPGEYPVTISWAAEIPDEEKLALLFQANCAEIGVNVEVQKRPFGTMIDDAQQPETTPNASVVYMAAHFAEAGAMLKSRYHSDSQGTTDQMEWLGDTTLDGMIDDALATPDQTERFAKYAKIQEYLVDLAPTIWVSDKGEQRAYQLDYFYWPVVDKAREGKPVCPYMGYFTYVKDMKIFVDKK